MEWRKLRKERNFLRFLYSEKSIQNELLKPVVVGQQLRFGNQVGERGTETQKSVCQALTLEEEDKTKQMNLIWEGANLASPLGK